MKNFVFGLVLGLSGIGACTAAQVQTAEASARDVFTKALGLVTLAAHNPEVVEEAKAALQKAVDKADPKDAANFSLALAHVNAGNIATAQQVLTVAVASVTK